MCIVTLYGVHIYPVRPPLNLIIGRINYINFIYVENLCIYSVFITPKSLVIEPSEYKHVNVHAIPSKCTRFASLHWDVLHPCTLVLLHSGNAAIIIFKMQWHDYMPICINAMFIIDIEYTQEHKSVWHIQFTFF